MKSERQQLETAERRRLTSQKYQAGETAVQIAEQLGIRPQTVYKYLKAAGIPANQQAVLTPAEEVELMRRYQAGERVPPLLKEFSINPTVLRNVRLRHGVEPRNRLPGHNKLLSAEGEAEVVDAYQRGLSQAKIGAEYGVSQAHIARILHRHGVVKVDLRARRQDHGRWIGGRIKIEGGYIGVRLYPDDPYFSMANSGSYVLEHRYVMAQALGRPLTRKETVHHINNIPDDNRLENLQLRQGQHGSGSVMACAACGSHDIQPVPLA